jgi:hypothetical protein
MTISKTPVTEPSTRRLMLITAEAASYGFAKLIGTVVRDAMEYRDPLPGENLYTTIGDDRNATGYRNAIWSSGKNNALFVDDFQIRCQLTMDDSHLIPYGFESVFKISGIVDRREVAAMQNTYVKFDRAYSKIHNEEGSAKTYASHLARSAAVLGISKFLVANTTTFASGWLSKPEEYREVGLVNLADAINELIGAYTK